MVDDLITEYKNIWMNFTSRIYDFGYQGSCGITGPIVSDYMTQILQNLQNGISSTNYLEPNGPFNGYVVETWHSTRANQTDDSTDWDIEHSAGLTLPKFSKINHQYANSKTYSHEFGHNYAATCGIFWEHDRRQIGLLLENEYKRIRSVDFTTRTPGVERIAEDFKFFFGAVGATGTDLNDDFYKGYQVRLAENVPGLKKFLQYAWPIHNWLKDKDVRNFNFLENECDGGWFKWENLTTGRWEAYAYGSFYKWSWGQWVSM